MSLPCPVPVSSPFCDPLSNSSNICFNAIILTGQGWPGLAIFAIIYSCHFFQSYTSSLLKPYHSKSFFRHSSNDFLGQPSFLFPLISTSITSCIWELMSPCMTCPYHCRWLQIITSLIFTITPTLSWRTSVDTLSTSLTPHILIIRHSTPCNLTSSATVSSHVSQ